MRASHHRSLLNEVVRPWCKKKARKVIADKPVIAVVLTRTECTTIGAALRIVDRATGLGAISQLEAVLGQFASERANVRNVMLRSDFVADIEPLARCAQQLQRALHDLNAPARDLWKHRHGMDDVALDAALTTIPRFLRWLRSQRSKKGGERATYEKGVRAAQEAAMASLFDQWAEQPEATRRYGTLQGRRDRFLHTARTAIERAVRAARQGAVE